MKVDLRQETDSELYDEQKLDPEENSRLLFTSLLPMAPRINPPEIYSFRTSLPTTEFPLLSGHQSTKLSS